MFEKRDGDLPLDLGSLRTAYATKSLSPTAVVDAVHARMSESPAPGVFVYEVGRSAALDAARHLEDRNPDELPLYGVPFAVKDNIDVKGWPTTAGCPDFAYVANRTAPVVARLLDAGALLLGKTNLDQFATGLVGTRSPYGIPTNPFDARYITGGSSSGSAAAVARGFASFALGTDTAGSGRIPAAFTNLVGLKPSRGLLSTTGVVPACRSLDCVSVFALHCEDARRVAEVATSFDPSDSYSRRDADGFHWLAPIPNAGFFFAVPREMDILPHVDGETMRGFEAARAHLEALGGRARAIDLTPFFDAARLLYDGPWIAERFQGLEAFLSGHPESVLPITRKILNEGAKWRASDLFDAIHRLDSLRRDVRPLFDDVHALLLPTAPIHPRIDEVLAEPLLLNARLGRYTNFVNLLDLAAVAVPSGMRGDGLPFGVTLVGGWGSDARLLALASALHERASRTLGAMPWPMTSGREIPKATAPSASTIGDDRVRIAVAGAHLSGQPLNHQLTERAARLLAKSRTSPRYRMFALPTTPPKPGLVRVPDGSPGFALEIEVWELPRAELGAFFRHVVKPLCLGTIELENGEEVPGFLCEAYATAGAPDISHLGGWRKFVAR
jgi:allophanate hydrolase